MPEKVTGVVFYTIEKAIKTYRKFAQHRIDRAGLGITIDQWLVLDSLKCNETISQNKLAELVFKDVASVTRIIDLLVKKGHLIRSEHPDDRRRFNLKITDSGKEIIEKVSSIVDENRQLALSGLDEACVTQIQSSLDQIISNCQ
ncbi:MAG TPA: MarR family transcriptional regulator [Marinilabiliales bacterium]|jgi:DNA-binding MarR family transcriptional regulator|nr:MAG: hypothetical protein A2W95_17510 [Bacteroidetes bacterium GWA2_40_14]OFX56988.1 MAG: hypothetical protein A2W84_11770 [Bacteroidetes bacterium GWC2_40_13]OFX74861.1 MAG: hypothetical protein A2W96_01915 [Bacteroidetes bacterium GWD2_40_43]OFX93404.1 MAG: hypothetical protein A2W97_15245 [Bacteroidetes bacterium GWE2_40_63]OFY18417.1 MAG: hypothetical protein A2W88_19165 [Bacteroidetes bacterium GWF2_40_13]OFZ26456.1 MAG: hypothetical protein A2437_08145 [Bacteroidetes bacterium RIFOXYC